jgi:hypothetical protein
MDAVSLGFGPRAGLRTPRYRGFFSKKSPRTMAPDSRGPEELVVTRVGELVRFHMGGRGIAAGRVRLVRLSVVY